MEGKFRKEFKWVVRVLESCKTEEHLIAVQKLFENFVTKNKNHIYCDGKDCLMEDLFREEFKHYLAIKSRTLIF